jgi:hypothetical protein
MGKPQQLNVAVSFSPAIGYISQANDHVPRSLTALSIEGLRKRVVVAFLSRPGKRDRPVSVHLTLDDSAQAELNRRRGCNLPVA